MDEVAEFLSPPTKIGLDHHQGRDGRVSAGSRVTSLRRKSPVRAAAAAPFLALVFDKTPTFGVSDSRAAAL